MSFFLFWISVRIGLNFKGRGIFLTHKRELLTGYTAKSVVEYYLDLLKFLLGQIVDQPEAIVINQSSDETGTVILTTTVAPKDMGKVIGRAGNTAKAIRTLLRIIGMKNNARVNLKVNEPEGSTRPAPISTTPVIKSVDEAMEDLKL